MPRIQLPDGARAVAADGSDRYTAGPGDTVNVSRGHLDAVRRFAHTGPTRGLRFGFGTRSGRVCVPCARVWNAWSVSCPRCGSDTQPEDGRD